MNTAELLAGRMRVYSAQLSVPVLVVADDEDDAHATAEAAIERVNGVVLDDGTSITFTADAILGDLAPATAEQRRRWGLGHE